MFKNEVERSELVRNEIVNEMCERMAFLKERGSDRIGAIWALKMIAENIARLDETDRQEGFLPLQVRPPLMLRTEEAALALHALRSYKELKGCEISGNTHALMEKLNCYFSGRE